ncbi:MAG: MBL fold metallo-hydrolase [Rhodobiaceae bacterium]|nr:MBL fold metallo-hydrolase [Rhodobiaceae bacterium]MCC0052111.1 MBL fold metallo-hydrolase [Rhodobiaceae bacterium]MCC0061369.1 MBL fold metallo-hydrolase [Rhodobiaceae bacterium]
MNTSTAVQTTSHDTTPAEVAPGIFRVTVPVPFRSLKAVNLWLLDDGDGFTMIDCGFNDDDTMARLENAWDAVLGGKPVNRLIVTHFHPDHIGNCRFICERWGLRPQMTQLEWMAANAALKSLYSDDYELRAKFWAQNGASPQLIELYRSETVLYDTGVELTEGFDRINTGETITAGGRDWLITTGQGHSPDLATLYNARDDILIAGDQILPKITTNVSVWPWEPLADPLREFIESLDRLGAIVTEKTFVLPSHREPFHNAQARIAELKHHHAERLEEVVALLEGHEARTAGELLEPLFKRELDGHQVNFAMGEALAHLNRLVFDRVVERHEDAGGLIRFSLRNTQH